MLLPRSLKGRLLIGVSALIISTSILISGVFAHLYRDSLFRWMIAQSENIAHSIVLEIADKILIDDLLSLQKILDQQVHNNKDIAYIFVYRDETVLAHTFSGGFPLGLLAVNQISFGKESQAQLIRSTTGEHFLDIAWPIFEGKGGVLRVGFTDKFYHYQLVKLWIQLAVATTGILALGLALSYLFIKRITKPLNMLTEAATKIGRAEFDITLEIKGEYTEVDQLTRAFNLMINYLKEHILHLERKKQELEHAYAQSKIQAQALERAYHQAQILGEIAQEIGRLQNLSEIGLFLIKKVQLLLEYRYMVLLILNEFQRTIVILSETETRTVKQPEHYYHFQQILNTIRTSTISNEIIISPPLIPSNFINKSPQAVIPIDYQSKRLGVLIIACSDKCQCNLKEMEIVKLILNQAGGAIERAILEEEKIRMIQQENTEELSKTSGFFGIIGKDAKMIALYKLIREIALSNSTVLIQGESGTGKELVAKAIHSLSPRKDKPFVVINCSAYPPTLLESELFGHEKGAFTGAIRQKLGRFEQAQGGTVFLDEIGEISPSAQIKLLRILQTHKFERIGGEKTIEVDVRILAATNKDLLEEVKAGNFREDLFYRLNVIPIHLPPLRERGNDILLLAHYFLHRFALQQKKEVKEFSPEAIRALLEYSWPGNVRELENCIEYAVVLTKGNQVQVSELPIMIQKFINSSYPINDKTPFFTMAEREKDIILHTLKECNGNKKLAARRLGISRNTLYLKLKKYQITTHSSLN